MKTKEEKSIPQLYKKNQTLENSMKSIVRTYNVMTQSMRLSLHGHSLGENFHFVIYLNKERDIDRIRLVEYYEGYHDYMMQQNLLELKRNHHS